MLIVPASRIYNNKKILTLFLEISIITLTERDASCTTSIGRRCSSEPIKGPTLYKDWAFVFHGLKILPDVLRLFLGWMSVCISLGANDLLDVGSENLGVGICHTTFSRLRGFGDLAGPYPFAILGYLMSFMIFS